MRCRWTRTSGHPLRLTSRPTSEKSKASRTTAPPEPVNQEPTTRHVSASVCRQRIRYPGLPEGRRVRGSTCRRLIDWGPVIHGVIALAVNAEWIASSVITESNPVASAMTLSLRRDSISFDDLHCGQITNDWPGSSQTPSDARYRFRSADGSLDRSVDSHSSMSCADAPCWKPQPVDGRQGSDPFSRIHPLSLPRLDALSSAGSPASTVYTRRQKRTLCPPPSVDSYAGTTAVEQALMHDHRS